MYFWRVDSTEQKKLMCQFIEAYIKWSMKNRIKWLLDKDRDTKINLSVFTVI